MYKLTLIIPVYNVESYIEECLNSVISQIEPEIQVICINDGSPDNSMAIIREMISRYPDKIQDQFLLVDQKNQGLSGARNTGISMAHGKYVGFLDSDDKLMPKYFETILNVINNSNFDILDFNIINSNGLTLRTHINTFDSVFSLKHWFAWARIYSIDILLENQFRKGIIYEDLDLVPKLYILADKIIHLNNTLYWYRVNYEGITNSFNLSNNIKTIQSLYSITNNYYDLYVSTNNEYYLILFIQSYYMLCINASKRVGYKKSLIYQKEFEKKLKSIEVEYSLLHTEVINKKFLYLLKYPKIFLSLYACYYKSKKLHSKYISNLCTRQKK